MTHYALLIDGQLHPGKQDDEVLDPATEQVVGYAARASQAQVDAAVNAAHNAFTGWAANPQARRTALALAASVLRENSQSLAELISREFLNRKLPLPSNTQIDLTLDTTLNANQLISDLLAVNRARQGQQEPEPTPAPAD